MENTIANQTHEQDVVMTMASENDWHGRAETSRIAGRIGRCRQSCRLPNRNFGTDWCRAIASLRDRNNAVGMRESFHNHALERFQVSTRDQRQFARNARGTPIIGIQIGQHLRGEV